MKLFRNQGSKNKLAEVENEKNVLDGSCFISSSHWEKEKSVCVSLEEKEMRVFVNALALTLTLTLTLFTACPDAESG